MKRIILRAKQYSQSIAPILIYGESGTGKELIAHSLHKHAKKNNQPFVPINCAAIPQNILESELFGYEEGTFTGAKKGGKPGIFEIAKSGTIFLDEIGEIPLDIQTKLLRVLQEKEVIRLGGSRVIPLDIRLITATNQPLSELVHQGKFREDLYYRINVLKISIPPLRERKDDIVPLFKYLLLKYGLNIEQINYLVKIGQNQLISYPWPGNIRELENFVLRLTALTSTLTTSYDLGTYFYDVAAEQFTTISYKDAQHINSDIPTIQKSEQLKILEALSKSNGNKNDAAKILGMSRTTLWRKVKHYNLL